MKPEYFAITFDMKGYDSDIWMALLSDWPFESFYDEANKITGYILKHDISQDMLEAMDAEKSIRFRDYQLEPVPDQNWNAVWESSFNPVVVDNYCYIRANFHQAPNQNFKHEVVIAPRMAFGTGHHATTYMMLQAMSGLDFMDRRVLDFGCGTGILSVVAALEGAREIIGIDIQPESIENSAEHAVLNDVKPMCTFLEGGLDLIGDEYFDIILANINVTVISAHFDRLKEILSPGGYILLSGIMTYDKGYMENHIVFAPLQVLQMRERNDWLQITLKQSSPPS